MFCFVILCNVCNKEALKKEIIPPDTPYLRKALERALKEYDQRIIKEKLALEGFPNKYVVEGKPGVTPIEYFKDKAPYLRDFLGNHRNIKVRFISVCLMEKMGKLSDKAIYINPKAYFQSKTHINLEATDVRVMLQ